MLTGKVLDSQKEGPLVGGYGAQVTTFVWLYALTRDQRYVEPFLYGLRQRKLPYPTYVFLGDLISLRVVGRT